MRRFAPFAALTCALGVLGPSMAARVVADVPTYTVEDLGTTIDGVVPSVTGINHDGQVAGSASTSSGQKPVVFSDGQGFAYLPGFDGVTANALAINNAGDVTGSAATPSGTRAYRFSAGSPTFIDPPSGATITQGMGINANGDVVGVTNAGGVRGFRQSVGLSTEVLQTLGGSTFGTAINDSGTVAGTSVNASNVQHAFRQPANGTIEDLQSLAAGTTSIASAIDAHGDVVGRSVTAGGVFHAFRYTNQMIDIDTLNSGFSNAMAVSGAVTVGSFQAPDFTNHAFVHTFADGMVDLNSRIPADSGWVLTTATGVNDKGQIVGMGLLNGVTRAYRLTPDQVPDTTPPVISSVVASPSSIVPPNGAMVAVSVTVAAADDSGEQPACSLTSITAPGAVDADAILTGQFTGSVRAVGNRTYTMHVTCADAAGNQSTASANVVVPPDTTAPVIRSVSVTPSFIWPPNGHMVTVTASVSASDDVDATPTCGITSVTSNQPSTGDAAIDSQFTAAVRASNGRVYTINVTCADDAGNASVGSATVTVGKDKTATTLKRSAMYLLVRHPRWHRGGHGRGRR